MAAFRKRGARWQAQVRRQGFPPVSKSFLVKADAEAWARQQETLADRGELTSAVQGHKLSQTTTVADIIIRYRDEVMPTHRGGNCLVQVVNAILRRPIANAKLADLTVTMANAYVADRLKTVKGGTVRRELDIAASRRRHPLRAIFDATSDADRKTKSRWVRALRFAWSERRRCCGLKHCLEANGGVAGCAGRWAEFRVATRTPPGFVRLGGEWAPEVPFLVDVRLLDEHGRLSRQSKH